MRPAPRSWLVAALLAMAVGMTLAGPAAAQPTAADVADVLEAIEREDPPDRAGQDLLGAMFGVRDGEVPLSHYELGASVGPIDRIVALQARSLFTTARWVLALGLHLVEWVLGFDLGRMLVDPAVRVAAIYATEVVGGLQLIHLALVVAVARGGWLLLRQRAHAGAAELAVALAITAMATAAMARPTTAACDGLRVLAGTTRAVVELGTGGADREPGTCGEPQGSALPTSFSATARDTFVVDPWMTLQWGSVPTGGCRQVADALVRKGPWGDDDFPRDRMEEAGCEDEMAFNAHMGVDRLVGALAHLLACLAFAAAVGVVAVMLLTGQVAGALLVMVMPFALTAGIAPGAGRELLARWGHAVLKVAVLFLGSAALLVLMVEAVHALQAGMQDQPVAMRMLASAAAAWTAVVLRKQVFGSMRFAAQSVAARAAGPGADVGAVGNDPEQRIGGIATQAVGAAVALKTGGASAIAAMRRGDSGEGVQTAGRGQRLLIAAAAARTSTTTVAAAGAVRGGPPAATTGPTTSPPARTTATTAGAAITAGAPRNALPSTTAATPPAAWSAPAPGGTGEPRELSPPVDARGRAVPEPVAHGNGTGGFLPVAVTPSLPSRILLPARATSEAGSSSRAGATDAGVPRGTAAGAVAALAARRTTSSQAWMVATLDRSTAGGRPDQPTGTGRPAATRSSGTGWSGVPVRMLPERGGGWDVEGMGLERSLALAFDSPAALGSGEPGAGVDRRPVDAPDQPRGPGVGSTPPASRAAEMGQRAAAATTPDAPDPRGPSTRRLGRPGGDR